MYKQKKFVTETEQYFYQILLEIEKEYDVKVQAQINLASIIEKKIKHKYANELFRNIDFCIFDKNLEHLLLAIEINDRTHLKKERKLRDEKVDNILKDANIKIIKFYTDKENKRIYVINRILKNIGLII